MPAASKLLTRWHRRVAVVLEIAVPLHVVAVLYLSARGEHLLRPMLTGRKPGLHADAGIVTDQVGLGADLRGGHAEREEHSDRADRAGAEAHGVKLRLWYVIPEYSESADPAIALLALVHAYTQPSPHCAVRRRPLRSGRSTGARTRHTRLAHRHFLHHRDGFHG